MKNSKYEIDMCNGSIMDKLISFSLPLMLSGILQLMFNAVDIIVVGRFSGSQAERKRSRRCNQSSIRSTKVRLLSATAQSVQASGLQSYRLYRVSQGSEAIKSQL